MPVEAADFGLSVTKMTKPQNQLFCRLDDLSPEQRQSLRLEALQANYLLASESVPVFEEVTQKASTFSGAPISILGLAIKDELWFKSAVGLSTVGLTNQLASQRKISLLESFSTYVVDSQQPLAIENTMSNAVFAHSILTQHYGIKSYLGVPLISSSGLCIGTLEVMDWQARQFNERDIEHLSLLARWCLGEFEREKIIQSKTEKYLEFNQQEWQQANSLRPNSVASFNSGINNNIPSNNHSSLLVQSRLDSQASVVAATNPIKIKLLSQLTQELKTPLTSVIGMASVLHREVYGPLTVKQREYLEIIHDSGQNLINLVDEIVSLGVLNDRNSEINAISADVEMLCQQVINNLSDSAKQHQQTLCLSVEPGNRIWSLDKEKVRQALYYLITSILEMSEAGGEIKVHVSKRNKALNIAVGISHPWLGENFGESSRNSQTVTKALSYNLDNTPKHSGFNAGMSDIALSNHQILTSTALMMTIDETETLDKGVNKIPRDVLGLLFCCHLTEIHKGRVVVQGSVGSSYRYVLQFPKTAAEAE